MGQGGITSELNPMGPGGLAKPQPTRPQHTTPDPEFATEVKTVTKNQTAADTTQPLTHTHTIVTCSVFVLPTGSAAHQSGGGAKPDSKGQLHGGHGKGEERPLRQDPCGWYHFP